MSRLWILFFAWWLVWGSVNELLHQRDTGYNVVGLAIAMALGWLAREGDLRLRKF